jgi:probable HAF family extracellular repeat protein
VSFPKFERAVIGGVLVLAPLFGAGCNDSVAPPTARTPPPVASVTVAPNTATLAMGDSLRLQSVVRDSAGDTLRDRPVVWTTSAETLATVSSAGLVKGLSIGTATVTATSEGKHGSATISVGPQPIIGWIGIHRSTSNDLTPGATLQLTAWFFDNNANRLPDRPVTWSSNNAGVATVDAATGLVTGVAVGTAFIYAAAPRFAGDHQGVSVLAIAGVTETDLGDLGGGAARANGINGPGVVVGLSTTASGAGHAFRWATGVGMQDLGTLGGAYSEAFAINGTGVIVGVATTPSGDEHAFRWTGAGGMKDLVALPGSRVSSALGINGAGEVVGESWDSLGQLHAIRWSATDSLQDLGTAPGGNAVATAITDAGEVVGYGNTLTDACGTSGCWPAPGPQIAVIWGSSGLVDLGIGTPSEAFAVNQQGAIVGDAGDPPVAYVRTAAGSVKLLTPNNGQAKAINTTGQLAGAASAGSSLWHPVLWLATGDVAFLSAAAGGATGVNDAQQIVGSVLDQNNRQRARLWTMGAAAPAAHGSPARRRAP